MQSSQEPLDRKEKREQIMKKGCQGSLSSMKPECECDVITTAGEEPRNYTEEPNSANFMVP